MKNILDEKPGGDMSGRQLASVQFVDDSDIKDKTVLDIGCGYGWSVLNFLQRNVKKIVGIEVTEEDLGTIRKNIKSDQLELRAASGTCLPFEANSFDTIVSWEVIEHIRRGDEKMMLAEAARVLKPGGVFYLSTPHSTFFTNSLDPAWWLVGHRHYSRALMETFGQDAGFEVEAVNIKGGWWSLISILNMYVSKWVLRRRPVFEKFFLEKDLADYGKDNGFANLFMKFRKPK